MRLFTVNKDGKMLPYKQKDFKELHIESDLEDLLENNPEYFFEDSRIMIIGRQITTNLNSAIDLLGIDVSGNLVVIELKRDKTSRDTIAQLLEYASFVDKLDYSQLNGIFQNYLNEESNLEEYHAQFFKGELKNKEVSFNKSMKLMIVAQEITREIRQTAQFLRQKGIDVYCASFKYFKSKNDEQIITIEFVVGEDNFICKSIETSSKPKIDKIKFLSELDGNGRKIFNKIFDFGDKNNLVYKWGSKGFSLNTKIENNLVVLIFGYPLNSVYKQSIYTGYDIISKKVKNAEKINDLYKRKIEQFGNFETAGLSARWIIDRDYTDDKINEFIDILKEVNQRIKENGLK
ncbi:MAG: endonuclease NucS domain-containing protein [Candidatus Helarchaeota archaeon]